MLYLHLCLKYPKVNEDIRSNISPLTSGSKWVPGKKMWQELPGILLVQNPLTQVFRRRKGPEGPGKVDSPTTSELVKRRDVGTC